jgi:4-amino-4-deoxy-L-arabinose transferase-like glycosyltransferase
MTADLKKQTPALNLFYSLVITAIVFLCAALWATIDDQNNQLAFSILSPLVEILNKAGLSLAKNGARLFYYTGGIACFPFIVWLFVILLKKSSSFRRAFIPLAVVNAVAAELSLITDKFEISIITACLSAICLILSPHEEQDSKIYLSDNADFFILTAILLFCSFFRFYALNRIFSGFEGELSPYMVAATSLHGMLLANNGIGSSWAPLGILYYIPIYITTHLFGATVLSVRLSSVLVNLFTITLAYHFTKRLASRSAAVIAALLLSLESLQIGWGRTDVHPHGATTWPAIIVCWLLYNALSTSRIRYWLYLIPALALTWHQYPSGQAAVFIPFLAVVLAFIFGHRKQVRLLAAIPSFIAGFVLWFMGATLLQYLTGNPQGFLSYFSSLGPRVYSAADPGGYVLHLAQNSSDFIQGVFYKAPKLFHQDIIIPFPEMPTRTVCWATAVLAALAVLHWMFKQRNIKGIVLFSWLICAMIPAVFSEYSYPKRGSTFYPCLCIFAGCMYAWLCDQIRRDSRWIKYLLGACAAVIFAGWSAVASYLWFSGTFIAYGTPTEELLVKQIAPSLNAKTPVIVNFWSSYLPGQLGLVFYDTLKNILPSAPPLILRDEKQAWAPVVIDPGKALPDFIAAPPLYYHWSDLPFPDLRDLDWRHFFFVVQRDQEGEEAFKKVLEIYPGSKVTDIRGNVAQNKFSIIEVRR